MKFVYTIEVLKLHKCSYWMLLDEYFIYKPSLTKYHTINGKNMLSLL